MIDCYINLSSGHAHLECGILAIHPRSDKIKDNKVCICCLLAKQAACSKSKDWLALGQNDNVSRVVKMPACGLLSQ